MNFYTRKYIALVFAIINICLAYAIRNNEYGIFMLFVSLGMICLIWFRKYVASVSYGIWKEPLVCEIEGWIFLILLLAYTLFAK